DALLVEGSSEKRLTRGRRLPTPWVPTRPPIEWQNQAQGVYSQELKRNATSGSVWARRLACLLASLGLSRSAFGQWTTVRLHPEWAEESVIYGLSGNTQVGQVMVVGSPRPALWNGTVTSAIPLAMSPG